MAFADLVYGGYFRYHFIPVTFVIGFTVLTQVLMIWTHNRQVTVDAILENLIGDLASWSITLGFFLWAWLSIAFSSKIHLGPETTFGFRPRYADNGFVYFVTTMLSFLLLQYFIPETSFILYEKFPKIIGVSNDLALLFCVWLLIKGKYYREHKKDIPEPSPLPYEYYRGMELHPKLFGMDVKQWTNCRVGMMSWPLFLTAFYIVFHNTHGYNAGYFMHYFLQMVYIAKFYWWETGYFHTMDMMLDRAGYYLCWGCLAFLPAYFCYPAGYVIQHPPDLSQVNAYAIAGLGLFLTALEYWVDQQKHGFRQAWPHKQYIIWGKPAKFIVAKYKDDNGDVKESALLTSGFWGLARHCNYSLESIISFTISASLGFNHGITTFAYFLLIAPLVVHRLIRDEKKCSQKYTTHWLKYKQQVKYGLIPGVI